MAKTTNRPQRANRSAAVDRDKDASEKTESTYLRLSWWNLSNGHMDCEDSFVHGSDEHEHDEHDEHENDEHESDDDSSNSSSHNSHTKDNDRSRATLDIASERTKLLRLIAAETKHKNERVELQRRRRAIRKATGRVVDDRGREGDGSDSLSSSSHSHNHNHKGETPSKKKKRTNKRRSSSNSSTTTDAADADADVHTTTTHAEHKPKKTKKKKKKTKKKKEEKKQQTNACAHVGGLGRIDFTGQITMSPSSTNSKHKQGGDHHKKVYQYDSKQKNSPKRKPSTKVRSIDPKILPPSSFARAQNPFGSERTLNSFHSNSSLTSCQNSKSKSNSLHSSMKSCLKDSANDRDTTPGPRSSDVDISSSNSSSSSSTCNGRPSATRFLIPTNDDIENAAANANATKKKSKKRSKSKKKTKKSQSRSKLFQKLSDSQITVSPGEDEIHDTPPLKRRKWKKVVHNLLKKTHLQLPHHHEQQQQQQQHPNKEHPNKEHPNKQAVDIPDVEINDSGRTASTAAETVAASSRSSIGMEEEEPPPPIPKKIVQFNPRVRVKRTLSHHDMSPNEKYAYWSSGSDGYDEYITEQILARQTEEWIQKKEEDYKEDCLQRKLHLLHQQIQEAY